MKHIFRSTRLGAGILALCCGFFNAVPACAQLTVGSNGLMVKAGSLISVDGLVLNPTADVTLTDNAITHSASTVTYAGISSISQVYTVDVPIPFTGTLRINYRTHALNGAAPENLKLVYAPADGDPFTLVAETMVNMAGRFIAYPFENPITLQQISALPLAINVAPTATNMTHTVTYAEDPGGPVALDDVVVTDPNIDEVITATLTLSDLAAGGLTTGTYGSATSTYNAGTGVWTVAGSVADVNAALAAVAFTPVANWDRQITITTRIRDAEDTGPEDGIISLTVTPVNDVPSVVNLNGDNVAWAGVGNAVVLDAGANASLKDIELEAADGGNGNWAGASLTVQREGIGVAADLFDFNTAGALFTVAGGNLQSGGQTFATYTRAGGVLTIAFTSSGTTATTALVNEVVQRISYRNDVPAGDATIRFLLSDGEDDAVPANVTVSSDLIYVTNSTDTYTIDASNGVSLSEAVAMATADGTGTQTLVFAGTLAGQTLTLAGDLSISEGLTMNTDAANGLVLSGHNIVLGAGTTLGITHNGDGQITVNSTITGGGQLAKTGSGSLVLSANNVYVGATTVNAGTLVITGSLAGPTSVLSNGTLAGNGVLGGNVVIGNGGTLSPGSSPGTLTIDGNLTMAAGSTLSVEIDGATAGTMYDQVVVNGFVDVSAATLAVTHGYTASQGEAYTIITNDAADAVTGMFTDVIEDGRITSGGNGTVLTASYLGGTGNDFTLTVSDVTPPTVTAITVSGTPSASASAIQFTVHFNEVPANITTTDFVLTTTGTASARIASNSPVNASTVTVTIDEIAGSGTLRLDVVNESGITDVAGNGDGNNGYVAAFAGGEVHIVDREAPAAPSQPDLDPGSDSGNSITDNITNDMTPTFSGTAEAGSIVTLYDSDGITGLGTAVATGGNWSITSSLLSEGDHNLTATATDAAGNTSAASVALAIQIDISAPTAAIALADTELNAEETTLVTITFNEPVLALTNDDLTVANGTLSPVSSADGGVTWTATLTPNEGVAEATNVITLNNAGVTDRAGNVGSGTTDSENYRIDNVRPTATIALSDAELNWGETALVTITFNRAVTGLSNADLTVPNGILSAVSSSDGGITWTTTFTPADDTDAPTNIITLDNSGVVDVVGNAGVGTTNSGNFVIRTNRITFIVTTNSDTGEDATMAASLAADESDGGGLSLREALAWARNGDTVTFITGINTITLNGNAVAVSQNHVIIDGDLDNDGSPDVTISANRASRVMYVNPNLSGIELIGLVLREGSVSGGGAGLHIGPGANVALRQSRIIDNAETGLGGGGVYGSGATLTVINSTVSGNSSSAFGGGIRIVGADGSLSVINSTVSGNTTTGANQHGGGIQYGGTGGLTIVNSTISGNAVLGSNSMGGGLRVTNGISYLYNTTIVGNASTGQGGGVHANGTDTFVNTVVAGNTSGAGAAAATGGAPLATGGTADDVSGTVELAIHNYFGSNVNITTNTNSLNNQGTGNLLLGGLMDNGGYVNTHKPLVGSALIGAGSVADLPADTYDVDEDGDTGEPLPMDATGGLRAPNGTVDIGAVEAFQGAVIVAVSTPSPDGIYKISDEIDITVTFNQVVTADFGGGSPTLLLETGDTDREAVYASGSGSNTLTFTYTVQAGDISADLDYFSTAALALNGATIRNGAGADAVLTLPAVGGAGSIAGQHALVIDGVPPVITSVDVPADGYHVEGDPLDFTVHFSEDVTVDASGGTPYFEVTIGTATVQAAYVSGSGTGALAFRYVVQAGEADLDGIALGGDMILNGGTLRDHAGNGALLTLHNAAPTDQVFVYSVRPTVTLSTESASPVKGPFTVTAVFSEAVTGFTVDDITVSNGTPGELQTSDNISYTFLVTPAVRGSVQLSVAADVAVNIADNGNDGSNTLVVQFDEIITGITLEEGSFVYDGTAKSLAITGTLPAGTSVSYGNNSRTEVGSQEVTATISGDNYEDLVLTAELTITPASITGVTLEEGSFVYDGTAKSLAITGTLPEGTSVSYGNNSRTDVGSQEVTATISGSNYRTLVLTAELTVTPLPVTVAAADRTKVFGTDDPELIYGVTPAPVAGDAFTGELAREEGEAVGGYAITRGTLSLSGNYSISFVGAELTIMPASITGVTLENGSFVYDGTAKSLAITGTLPEGTSVSYGNNSRTEVGSQEVTATISGSNYETLTLKATLTITPEERSIDFPPLPEKVYGNPDFEGGATASSGERVIYTSSNETVAEITSDGRIRIVGAGEATIMATVPENSNYVDHPEVSRRLVVSKAVQTITFNAPTEIQRDAGSVPLEVSASSGLPVRLAIDDEQVATLEGTALQVHRLGTVRITATQAGDANHDPADPVTVTVRVIDPSADFAVKVHPLVSPNGDGVNEFLMVEGIRDYPENRVTVFNRNGTVLWEAGGYDNNRMVFRGISTGQLLLPAGTYFYIVEVRVDGKWLNKKGYFVLRY